MRATLTTLPNGVRVIVDPMPGLESAALGVWFRAGAMDEMTEEHGVAHLLEHMAFKGTTTRSARRIAEEIEAVGGYLNASTGYSRTGYYARVLKQDIGVAFDVLADILTNPTFDAAELDKEREVVLQEIGEAADQPDDVVMEALQAQSFGAHPLGRPILGTNESVASHKRDRLIAFMARNYTPQDLVVAAAGGVDVDAVMALAQEHFGARPTSARPARSSPAVFSGGVAHDARDIEQTHVAIALPGASVLAPDYFATRVFVEALGGGMSSRIFQSVREERGLAYSVYSFSDSYEEVGTVGAYVGTDAAKAPEAVSLIRQEITAMAAGATEQEVARSKAMLKSTILMGLESPSTRTESAVGQLYAHGRLLGADDLKERIDRVCVAEVRAAAGKALTGASALSIVGAADLEAVRAALAG